MADKKINISLNISAQTQDLKAKVQEIQNNLNKVNIPGLNKNGFEKELLSLQTRLEKLLQISNKPEGLLKASDLKSAEKEISNIQSGLKGLIQQLDRAGSLSQKEKLKFLPDGEYEKIKKITNAVAKYNNALNTQNSRLEQIAKAELKVEQATTARDKKQREIEAFSIKDRKSDKFYSQKENEFITASKEEKRLNEIRKANGLNKNSKDYNGNAKISLDGQSVTVDEFYKRLKLAKEEAARLKKELGNIYTDSQLEKANVDLGMLEQELKTAKAALKALSPDQVTVAFEELKKAATELGISLEGIGSADDVQILLNRIEQFNASKVKQLDRDFDGLRNSISELTPEARKMGKEIQKTGDNFDLAAAKAQELSSLKNRVLSFFSVTGAIQLFRRAIRSAFETVKDLDKAMTEIAVVSKFSVNDMWSQLPRFTDNANELGLSIRDVYDATTLYVQQGLDLDQSLELSTETLKMAAIAGLDAAAATDAMTSALRGFNMELNEDSAQKVSDIYSKLAAITASDVEELSTAMSKTASIAHSVNMEFETTASFLAQGIETTREAAETIGTMLKTVIGRFSEVKSLYSEGQITGTDEEGEAIDVNKVQTALRAAGVSMTDFLTGKEGLDQIFLRLAERWNDLDVLTQRYIATMAAGSRQQSRFIAIMQDYTKTTQLINAAYNSAGASQEQFEKTLDSLQAKLTRLKTAWNEFTMGLSNNEIIGGVVTVLTEMLKAVNGLIDGLSGGSGLVKSVLSLGAAFVGIRAGGAILDKILKSDFAQRKFAAVRGDTSGIEENENRKKGGAFTRAFGSVKQLRTDYKNQAGDKRRRKQVIKNFFVGEEETQQKIQKSYIKETENISQSLASAKESMGGFITSEDTNNVDALVNSFRNGSISAEDFSKKLTKMGINEEQAAVHVANLQRANEQQAISVQNVGTAIAGVGAALSVLGLIFSQFGEEGEKVGKVISVIGTGLVTLGMLLPQLVIGIKAIDTTLKAFKASHPMLFAITVALTAIIGLITTISAISNANSPEKKLEKATEAANDAKKAADEASQAYDELLSKKSEFDKLTTSIETLTQGTLEWRKALAEANNEVINLQKEFPELEVSVDKATGQLKIDNWGDVLKAQAERIEATNKQLAMAQVNENNAQLAVTKKNISNNNDLTAEQKVSQIEVEQLKTETNNLALIDSIISKYKTDKNKDYLDNFGELLTKEATYNTYRHNSEGEKVISGEKTENVFEKAIKNRANKIINEKSTDEQKEYAEQIFGKEAVANMKDDEEIKNAILNYEKANQVEKLTEKILSYSEEDQKAFQVLQGSFSGKVSDWNISDYSSLSDEQLKRFQEDLNLESTDAVKSLLNQGKLQIKDTIDKATRNFTNLGFDDNFIDQFSLDNLSNISSQISEMSNQSAKEYLEAFNEAINNTGLQGEEKKRLENYLSSIDLSDAVQVLDAKEFMKNLGMDETQIAKFWATANTAVEPYITSLEQVQSLNERISKLGEVRNLVENGEKTFSSSDKESLISVGFADTDFLQTGIDEWTYVGKDSNDLLRQINEKVAQIGEHIVGNLQDSVEKGKAYGTIIENNDELGKNLATLAENGYEGTSFEPNELKEMAKTLGIAVEKLSDEGIAKKLIDAYNMYKNLGENEEAVRKELVNNASRQYDLTGDFGTFTGDLTPEEQRDIMKAQLIKNTGAMELYNKLKAEINDTSKELNVELANEAIQLVKLTDRYKGATKKVEDYRDILIQGESAGTDFFAALDNAKSDLSTLFNVDKGLLTDEFIQQYAQDIYNLAEGGEVGTQAFQNLWEAMKQIKLDSMVEGLDFFIKDGEDVIDDFTNWVEGLDPTIGIGTELSTEGLESGLVLLAQQAHNAGKDVQTALAPAIAMLEELTGTKINIKYEEEEFDSGGRYISAKSMEGLLAQGWHVGKGGKLVRTKAITAISASKAGSPYDKFVAPSISSSGKSSTGSSSSKKESTWENPYDKLYNLTEEINEALRQREKLEREYDRILERRGSTFQELRKNYSSQLQSLQKEIALQNQLRAGRLAQLNALSSETYKGQDSDGNELIKSFADWGATRYGSYDPNTGLLKIDWEAIDTVKDENLGGAIEAYISRLEELEGQIEDIDTQIEDFQDKVTELQKEGMQDYLDFEQKVYDAIVNQQQQLIDDYQDLSDKINDSNSKILDSIQRSIDLQRQIRDNTKTEEDINEKEARLAYLRQDTSNGNLLEIKQLEEELADDRQNYEDNLIDQQLERLTQQNDDAQTARERQIDLMQKQLDYASKNGDFWNQTYDLLTNAFTESGEINLASQVWGLLKKDEGWKGMSKFGQLNWQEEISKAILAASHGYANWNMYKAKEVDKNLVTSNGLSLHYDGSNWVDSSGNIYSGVDYDSKIGGFTYSGMTKAPTPSGGSGNSSGSGSGGSSGSGDTISIGSRVKADPNAVIYADSYGGGGGRQYYSNDPIYTVLDENNGYYLTRYHGVSGGYTGWFRKKDLTAYKTGGIADFTGPAWLDGTKSNPELILNARDTENFIALKDILSSIMDRKGLQNNTQSVGDMYFNIDINVDELSNDYDVEDLSRKIKQEITDSAMYRNVNLVNFIR